MSVGSMSVVIAFALGCVSLFVGHVPPFRDAGRAKMSTRWITTNTMRDGRSGKQQPGLTL